MDGLFPGNKLRLQKNPALPLVLTLSVPGTCALSNDHVLTLLCTHVLSPAYSLSRHRPQAPLPAHDCIQKGKILPRTSE